MISTLYVNITLRGYIQKAVAQKKGQTKVKSYGEPCLITRCFVMLHCALKHYVCTYTYRNIFRAREAEGLTADLHLCLLSSKSILPCYPASSAQTACYRLSPSLPPCPPLQGITQILPSLFPSPSHHFTPVPTSGRHSLEICRELKPVAQVA